MLGLKWDWKKSEKHRCFVIHGEGALTVYKRHVSPHVLTSCPTSVQSHACVNTGSVIHPTPCGNLSPVIPLVSKCIYVLDQLHTTKRNRPPGSSSPRLSVGLSDAQLDRLKPISLQSVALSLCLSVCVSVALSVRLLWWISGHTGHTPYPKSV